MKEQPPRKTFMATHLKLTLTRRGNAANRTKESAAKVKRTFLDDRVARVWVGVLDRDCLHGNPGCEMILQPEGKTLTVPLTWPVCPYRVVYGEWGTITLIPIEEEE